MATKRLTKFAIVYRVAITMDDMKAILKAERFGFGIKGPTPIQPPLSVRLEELKPVTRVYYDGPGIFVTINAKQDSDKLRVKIAKLVAVFIGEAYQHNGLEKEYNSMNDFQNAVKKAGLWIDRSVFEVMRDDGIVGSYHYSKGPGTVTVRMFK